MGSALPIKIENPFFCIMEVNFNCALRSHDFWGNPLAKTEHSTPIVFMYVRNVRKQRLATGGDRGERVRSYAMPHRSSVGMPFCGRLKRLREEANACIPSLSDENRPDVEDRGHITRESLDARLRQVSCECVAGTYSRTSTKSGPLIQLRTARFEGGLEGKKKTY